MKSMRTTRSERVYAPPHITTFGAEEKLMNVSDAHEALAREQKTTDDWLEQLNIASAHYLLGDVERALELATAALEQDRNQATLLNVAVILETYGRFEEAIDLILEAYRLDPTDGYAGTMCANSLLRLGRWEEAWPLFIQWQANVNFLRPFIPEWPGPSVSLKGKRILVIDGGGFGDNIFFLRWLPKLKALGAHVTLKCPSGFGPLVSSLPYIDSIVGGGEPNKTFEFYPKDYDYFVSLLMLGHRFGITLENCGPIVPYIHADSEQLRLRRMCLVRSQAVPVTGICWKAGELESPIRHRSLLRSQVERILKARIPTGCDWVSLVYDEPPPRNTGASILEPSIRNWGDTAAILGCLNLVVTTDTGVAHLAGAMGISAWVILPGISAWQYLVKSTSHPLYPSMRLFRNAGEGIDNAVDSVIAALEDL
jgi:hypothetical protein